MFKKSSPLQSKREIILRNIVVLAMVVFFIVFLIIPIGIAFAGSFHEWNPLSGTYKFLGLENYKQVFTSKFFGSCNCFQSRSGTGNRVCYLFNAYKA